MCVWLPRWRSTDTTDNQRWDLYLFLFHFTVSHWPCGRPSKTLVAPPELRARNLTVFASKMKHISQLEFKSFVWVCCWCCFWENRGNRTVRLCFQNRFAFWRTNSEMSSKFKLEKWTRNKSNKTIFRSSSISGLFKWSNELKLVSNKLLFQQHVFMPNLIESTITGSN